MPAHRKTLKRFEIKEQPRFLTCSCYQRLPLFMNDAIKDAFVDRLILVQQAFDLRILAWVIMKEHFHVIVVPGTPEPTIRQILTRIKRPFAAEVLARWRELNAPILDRNRDSRGDLHFWQKGGGYDRNIRSPAELRKKIDYVHGNPVKRDLAARPIDWKWSSAPWYLMCDGYRGPVIDRPVFSGESGAEHGLP